MSMTIRYGMITAGAALLALLPATAAESAHSFEGASLTLRNLVANVAVDVVPGQSGIAVRVEGKDEMVQRIEFLREGDRAVVVMREQESWRPWNSQPSGDLKVTVTLPAGADFAIDGFVGKALVGDLDGPIDIEATAGDVVIGRVTGANVRVAGSADIKVGTVSGPLNLRTSGSGSLTAGPAGPTSISISGSGEATVASVSGQLKIDISGSADVDVGRVDDRTDIEISGSGDVRLRGGRATAFTLDSSGSGDVKFAGTAVNPRISASGSGEVCLAAVEGSLETSGASVTIDPARCGS